MSELTLQQKEEFEQVFKETLGDYFALAGDIIKITDRFVKFDIIYQKYLQSVYNDGDRTLQEAYRIQMDLLYRSIKEMLMEFIPTVEEGCKILFPNDMERYGGFIGKIIAELSMEYNLAQLAEAVKENPDSKELMSAVEWAKKYRKDVMDIESKLQFIPSYGKHLANLTSEIKKTVAESDDVDEVVSKYGEIPVGCDRWMLLRSDIMVNGYLYTEEMLQQDHEGSSYIAHCAWMHNCPYPDGECPIRSDPNPDESGLE